MFVTSHINFWPLSSFVRVSFEVTRTIRNNKQHFTWGCSILLLKKEKGPETGFLFFQWFWHFKSNSNHNLPSYSLFSKCFSCFFFHSSSRAWLALALASCLPPFYRETVKNLACSADLSLLNETKGSWFLLSCLSSYQNKWSKQTFFYNDINI